MADDAAGAVRRTPRPAPEPDVDELVNQTQMLGFGVERGVATLSLKPPHEIVVAWVDAARAMLGDAPNYSETRIDFPTEKAEMEVSAAGEFDRFVFTVQRAGRLTPHEARRKAETDRDLAVWLHAELQHKLTLPCGDCHPCNNWADETWRRAGRKPPHVVTWEDKLAETRGLYARLDDAIKLIEEMSNHLRQEPALTIGVETRLAALQGDQPAEPEVTPPWFVVRHCCEAGAVEYPKPCPWHAAPAEPESRCMNGPAKQHTLRVVEVIKALRAASADGVLPGELDDLDSFAQLARAIVDHWPTGEADRG